MVVVYWGQIRLPEQEINMTCPYANLYLKSRKVFAFSFFTALYSVNWWALEVTWQMKWGNSTVFM